MWKRRAQEPKSVTMEGVVAHFDASSRSLVIYGSDQELEVLSMPSSIALKFHEALEVDVSGNKMLSLQGFEQFRLARTLVLDNNYLEGESVAVSAPLKQVTTVSLNNNRVTSCHKLAISLAQSFPALTHLSVINNPLLPIEQMDSEEYEEHRCYLIYKLPALKTLDHREVTADERMRAEVTSGGTVKLSVKTSSPGYIGPPPDNTLKQDETQKALVQGKKKKKRKKRRRRKPVPRQDEDESFSYMSSSDDEDSQELVVRAKPSSKPISLLPDTDSDEDEAPPTKPSCRNLPISRSISLSGARLVDHYELDVEVKAPQGRVVAREGWLFLRSGRKFERFFFVLRGGNLYKYGGPDDEIYLEQITVRYHVWSSSNNKQRKHCFKAERESDKLVFSAKDEWDKASWLLELQKMGGKRAAAPARTRRMSFSRN